MNLLPDLHSPIALSAEEGDAIRVLDALLGFARAESAVPVNIHPVREALLTAGASRIRAAVLRFLVEDGGFRERQVLRKGRRVLGRAWSPELGGALRLEYTTATETLWLECARNLPTLVTAKGQGQSQGASEGDRKHRRMLRDMVTTAHTASGDWIFYAMVQRNLSGFQLSLEDQNNLTRKLRQGSPLATLFALDSDLTGSELRGRLGRLCEPSVVRVVECLEDRLAEAWMSVVSAAWSRYDTAAARTTRWNTLARVLSGWIDAIDDARRMDLARPALKLFARVTRETFARGGEAVRAELSNVGWVRTMKEREDLLAAVGAFVAVATGLLQRRDTLAMERYGDDRYDEAQIYLRDVSELLAPSRRGIEGVARALSDSIG